MGGPGGNKVIGVAFEVLTEGEAVGYVIPTPVLEHFLEDLRRNGRSVAAKVDPHVNVPGCDSSSACVSPAALVPRSDLGRSADVADKHRERCFCPPLPTPQAHGLVRLGADVAEPGEQGHARLPRPAP